MSYDDHGIQIIGPAPQDKDADERRDRQAQRTYEDKQIALQRGILRTQAALVIFGIVGAGISIWQASTAQQSADTSEKSVLVAQKSEREAVRSADLARIDAKHANDVVSKSADDALRATIDNFQREQRAWVALASVSTEPAIIPFPIKGEDKILVAHAVLENYGDTPAINVMFKSNVAFGMHGPQTKKDIEWALQVKHLNTQQISQYISPHAKTILADGKAAIRPPIKYGEYLEVWTYVGRIDYDDIFNRHHWLTFCYSLAGESTWIACPYGNEEDKGN